MSLQTDLQALTAAGTTLGNALKTKISAKADTSTVNTALAAKASTQALSDGLASKADATAMTTALAAKANATDLKSMGRRDVIIGTTDPTAGQGNDGDIYLKTT